MIINWDERFEIGIAEFDAHHKHLVSLLNKMFSGFVGEIPRQEALREVLTECIDYATYHFAAEERVMEASRYPGLEDHRAEHVRFGRRVEEMQRSFLDGTSTVGLELLQFIRNWLLNHILTADAEFGRHMSKDGVKKDLLAGVGARS